MGPIFIVGAPRSGTSLLRVILNRHPEIGLCDETFFFYYVYLRRWAFGSLSVKANRRRLVERYLETNRVKRLRLDQDRLSAMLMEEGISYEAFFESLMRFYAAEQGKRRFGEKTPQHALQAEVLCQWYSGCKLIHLVRDPRDVVTSLLRMPWASSNALANARTWLSCNLAAGRCRNLENYLLVRYEDLVGQPEAELGRICDFLREDFSPQMMKPIGSVGADLWWFQRAQGQISADRLGTWRERLSAGEVALVEWIVGPCMRQYGYRPSGHSVSFSKMIAGRVGELFDFARRKITHWPRSWHYWVQPTHLAAEEARIDMRL